MHVPTIRAVPRSQFSIQLNIRDGTDTEIDTDIDIRSDVKLVKLKSTDKVMWVRSLWNP